MTHPSFPTWLFVVSVAALSTAVSASAVSAKTSEQRLAPADASIGARVGASVDVDKDTLVLGAPDDQESGPFGGAVYVFEKKGQNWQRAAKLLGPAPAGYREFGESVAVSGHTIVVGAPFDGPIGESRGAAYVYARTGGKWTLQAKLTAADSSLNQLFGDAVAIDGNTIAVGAFLDSAAAPNAGAVYVFKRSGNKWTQSAKLTASDASEFAFFGAALAVEDKTIAIGAPVAETAYVFTERGGQWTETAILTAPDASISDYSAFGASVALNDSTIVVGAPTEGTYAPRTGAAYTFSRKGKRWTAETKLRASDAGGEDEFGTSVDVDGKQIAVGSPYRDDFNNGAIYLFRSRGNDWREDQVLTGHPTTPFLGASVALKKHALIAGAPGFVEYTGLQSAGAGYIYRTP